MSVMNTVIGWPEHSGFSLHLTCMNNAQHHVKQLAAAHASIKPNEGMHASSSSRQQIE